MKYLIKSSIIAITFVLLSCTSDINKTNYDKISNGMSVSQVENILGKGESQASSNVDLGEFGGNISNEIITWQSGSKIISITFTNGRVEAKAQVGL